MAGTGVEGKPSWTARHYILAGLAGCLAATAIVIIASIILSPGRIVFAVTGATQVATPDGGSDLRLTIRANNTSGHRARVKYLSFFVVFSNSSTTSGRSFTWDALVQTKFPYPEHGRAYLPERAGNTTEITINASVHMVQGEMNSSFSGQQLDADGLTLELTSQVRFLIGVAPTKIFDIKVSCPGVTFVQQDEKNKPQAQKAFECA